MDMRSASGEKQIGLFVVMEVRHNATPRRDVPLLRA
jgi:hypothetical protein